MQSDLQILNSEDMEDNMAWSESQWRRVIGLLPFNNLFYIAPIFDFWVIPEIMDTTGGKKRKTRLERAEEKSGTKSTRRRKR